MILIEKNQSYVGLCTVVLLALLVLMSGSFLYAKDVPLAVRFDLSQQGVDVSQHPKLNVIVEGGVDRSKGYCKLSITPHAYQGVVVTSSINDFVIQPLKGTCQEFEQGIEISFKKDGEYTLFGEAALSGYGASNWYFFIVRDGKVFGGITADDAEWNILQEKNRRLLTPMKNESLQTLFKERYTERREQERLNRK